MNTRSNEKLTSCPTLYRAIILLFFIWGFVTILNDLLVPIFKQDFHLTYTKALLVQFVFFTAYFLLALPMTAVVNRFRYKKSIVMALGILAIGALCFIPAKHLHNYYLFLGALFILAVGVVALQVSVNPMVTLLGSQQTASARITLAQALNSAGTVAAPLLLQSIISNKTLTPIYITMSIVVILMAWFIYTRNFNLPTITNESRSASMHAKQHVNRSPWQSTGFLFCTLGIFFYVGSEVSAGSLFISFAQLPDILSLSIKQASFYLGGFWGLAMVGRFLGSYILTRIKDNILLFFAAIINMCLVCSITLNSGVIAFASLIALGLFNSIMFPVIFAIGLSHFNSEALKNRASGYLIMAIVGGAVMPILQGAIADYAGLHRSFWLLLVGYAFIATLAFYHMKNRSKDPLNT